MWVAAFHQSPRERVGEEGLPLWIPRLKRNGGRRGGSRCRLGLTARRCAELRRAVSGWLPVLRVSGEQLTQTFGSDVPGIQH